MDHFEFLHDSFCKIHISCFQLTYLLNKIHFGSKMLGVNAIYTLKKARKSCRSTPFFVKFSSFLGLNIQVYGGF